MSDILADLTVIERALQTRRERAAKTAARIEDAAMMGLPMPQREELLAEAMTHAKHVYMETLSEAQQDVALLRLDIGDKWPDPNVMDSYVFLVSEVGEVGDALLRAGYGHSADYVRNHTKYVFIEHELGDVYLMLCTLATKLGIDLDDALQGCIDKLRSKHGES